MTHPAAETATLPKREGKEFGFTGMSVASTLCDPFETGGERGDPPTVPGD